MMPRIHKVVHERQEALHRLPFLRLINLLHTIHVAKVSWWHPCIHMWQQPIDLKYGSNPVTMKHSFQRSPMKINPQFPGSLHFLWIHTQQPAWYWCSALGRKHACIPHGPSAGRFGLPHHPSGINSGTCFLDCEHTHGPSWTAWAFPSTSCSSHHCPTSRRFPQGPSQTDGQSPNPCRLWSSTWSLDINNFQILFKFLNPTTLIQESKVARTSAALALAPALAARTNPCHNQHHPARTPWLALWP